MAETRRIIVLIDMDCFYVQVEQRRDPSIRGKPCAVVQYNQWKGGGIIAVSYEARAQGVSRNMRGDDAKAKCPEIILCMVPTANEKADLTIYRDAGAEVIQVLLQFGGRVERASIDEAYIDLTEIVDKKISNGQADSLPPLSDLPHTYVLGQSKEMIENTAEDKESQRIRELAELRAQSCDSKDFLRLLIAASLVEEIRSAVYQQTSFRCSAGISHNKMLSKLACGINKPNKQSILSMEGVPHLFRKIKIGKIRNLGGKLGQTLTTNFGIECIGQLTDIPQDVLLERYGNKTGMWLHEICRGIDHEPVKERHIAQSVGCSKTFLGAQALDKRSKMKHWIQCLATELVERLTKDQYANGRIARGLTLYVGLSGRRKSVSRACPIERYDIDQVSRDCLTTLEQLNEYRDRKSDEWSPAVSMIGMSAKNFTEDLNSNAKTKSNKKNQSIHTFMTSPSKAATASKNVIETSTVEHSSLKSEGDNDFSLKKTKVIPKTEKEHKSRFLSLFNSVKTSGKLPISKHDDVETKVDAPENAYRKKGGGKKSYSFFAQMKSIKGEDMAVCKIEKEYMKTCNKKRENLHSSAGEVSGERESKRPKENDVKAESLLTQEDQKRGGNSETPSNLPNQNGGQAESDHFRYDMNSIDMSVFNSLPEYMQKEIRKLSQQVDTSETSLTNKRRNIELSGNQKSISDFLTPTKPSFKGSKTQSPKVKRIKPKASKQGNQDTICFNTNYTGHLSKSVPLGFFRARTQASAAIRSAVAKRAQKRKAEPSHQVEDKHPNSQSSATPRPLLSTQGLTQVQDDHTLWSSIVKEDMYEKYCTLSSFAHNEDVEDL